LIEAKHYEPNKQTYHFSKPETGKPESWEQELSELEKFFKRTELPVTEIKTSEGTITDIHIFINCNLTTAKAQNGNHTYLPYLYRLRELNQILLKSNN
jgi:hypothetical protein